MPLADGEMFAGYLIIRRLGAGGMGEVYLVQHPRLPRREALKILPSALTNDVDFRERFHREADIAATLWHPNIVAIHDRGEFEGQIWITMDYVEGTDASRLLNERYPNGMPAEEALAIVRATAGALDHAHQQGLLHRDVKPANILLTTPAAGQRRVLLADFGIARKQDEISGLTATNMTVGSVTYAAPEQLTGEPLDGRADQYALACTAFHLIVGSPPFDNSNPAVVIGRHLTAEPPRPSGRRAELARYDGALIRAMAKDPQHRFATCEEFADALSAPPHRVVMTNPRETAAAAAPTMAASIPDVVRPPGPPRSHWQPATAGPPASPQQWPSTPPPSGRSRAPLWAAAGGVVAAVVLALVVFLAIRPGDDAASATEESTTSLARITTTSNIEPSAVTSEESSPEPPPPPPPPPPPAPVVVPGDLGLSIPMTRPACDGTGIVVLYNAVTPGAYVEEIGQALASHPGASYLRTDQSCPSLRQRDGNGNVIYAVYRVAGRTQAEVCGAVRSAGDGAYGKWLDTSTDPAFILPC
ncbi:MAG: serine/threonine-protein kinase [Mycobacterium sp.]